VVARLDRVIGPGGAVHEDKPDTHVVRVKVESNDVVGAVCLPAIFKAPTIRISFSLAAASTVFGWFVSWISSVVALDLWTLSLPGGPVVGSRNYEHMSRGWGDGVR